MVVAGSGGVPACPIMLPPRDRMQHLSPIATVPLCDGERALV
nr:MAG TPA: hypothetical protein [Caudoviricetes sp.]